VIPTRYPVSQPPASADTTIKSFALHLDGQSNMLEGGIPADRTYRIFGVPARCGANVARATFTSGDARTLSTQQDLSVTGCPNAGAGYSTSGRTARLNGSQSSTPLAGRSIAHWAWTFDDGSRTVTDAPTVSHAFRDSRDHTVGLTVTDSAGAVSEPISLVVPGSAVTVRAKAKKRSIRVSGLLTLGPTGAGAPGPVSVDLLRRKPHRKRFAKVGSKSTRARSSGAYSLSFARPKGGLCRVIASFGDSSHLESSAKRSFKC
jgi:PKD domain